MRRFAVRLMVSGILSALLATVPSVGPVYAGGDPPASEAPAPKKKKGASYIEEPSFVEGYRVAYATIYDRNDFAAAIDQLRALGRDDNAAVANLIGYAYRKLGNYQLSQVWYERALRSDPNHVRTWQYYGLWQVEQGNREQAQYHLSRIASLCGTGCEEYRSLADALGRQPGTGLVY
ncbi:MAG: tetratricopeptide repeat protein [bacterium]|nr:tetratricopeptide repeat protein [bacterium]